MYSKLLLAAVDLLENCELSNPEAKKAARNLQEIIYENTYMTELLRDAQDMYGYANQITVAIEELCELATVLAKYPRYADHEKGLKALKILAVDELADVTVVCKHVEMIFDITPQELDKRIKSKLGRLARWLKDGPTKTLSDTLQDRGVK